MIQPDTVAPQIIVADPARLSCDTLLISLSSRLPFARLDIVRDLESLQEILSRSPDTDLCFADWHVFGARPLDEVERISGMLGQGALVVLSDELGADMCAPLLKAGVRAAFSRNTGFLTLLEAIPDLLAGKTMFRLPDSVGIASSLMTDLGLTRREAQVVVRYVAGATYAVIAGQLGISASTVRVHVTNIHEKLGASSRAEVYAMLRRHPALRLKESALLTPPPANP